MSTDGDSTVVKRIWMERCPSAVPCDSVPSATRKCVLFCVCGVCVCACLLRHTQRVTNTMTLLSIFRSCARACSHVKCVRADAEHEKQDTKGC